MNIPKEKEAYFQKIALNLIRVSDDFKSILQSEFPNIYADIQSAATNPNCGCVKKVETELLDNREKSLNLLNNFLSNKDNLEKINEVLSVDYAALSPKPYSGRMFVIDNTEEKFKEFMDTINKDRAVFRNFSTAISPEGKLHVYFL
jgi:hypothetical protein